MNYKLLHGTEESAFEVWNEGEYANLDEAKEALRQAVESTLDDEGVEEIAAEDLIDNNGMSADTQDTCEYRHAFEIECEENPNARKHIESLHDEWMDIADFDE